MTNFARFFEKNIDIMNIQTKQIDDLNLQLILTISKEDYSGEETKKLKELRRNAEFKGFRKGMVPMSLIQRVYGEQALVESVNTVISEQLNSYINDNKLRIVGEPLTSEDQEQVEWKSGNDFTFKFDIATTPEITFEVSKDDTLTYYVIDVNDKAREEMKANMLRQFGSMQEAETAGEEDYVIADLTNGEHSVESVYISIPNVAGDARKKFVGAKAGSKIKLDVNKAFTNETDRASLLKVEKDKLSELNPKFEVTVVNIKTFVPAEENQETYDKMFGEGVVKTSAEFDAKIDERIKANYKQEADYRFSKDARDYFMDKASIALPEAFLKRWLLEANRGKVTEEEIEKEFDAFLADFRWQLVRGRIMQQFGLKVEESDIHEAAEAYAAYQYAMYGLGNVPQEQLHEAAHYFLSDERQRRRLEEQVEDNKAITAIREHATLKNKKISHDKFIALK